MASAGTGKGKGKGKRPGQEKIPGPEVAPQTEVAQDRAITLADAIERLDEVINDSPPPRTEDPGLDSAPDEDDWDAHEYDEEGPHRDEDDPAEYAGGDALLEAPGPGQDPLPWPRIVFDRTGGVVIPAESRLQRRIGGMEAPSPALMVRLEAIRLIRAVAERIMWEWKAILLDPQKGPHDLPPVTQKEFADRAGIADKSRMNRIVQGSYVKTPHWGILSMSQFFRAAEAREEAWDQVLDDAIRWIKTEEVRSPSSSVKIWAGVKQILFANNITVPTSERMLRKRLNERGIPADSATRREIYTYVKKWWRDNGKPEKYPISMIPSLRDLLIDQYGLFSSKVGMEVQKDKYWPFVKERMEEVLRYLQVELIP